MIKNYLIYDGHDILDLSFKPNNTRNEIHTQIIKALNKMMPDINLKPHELELIIPEPYEIRYLETQFSDEYLKAMTAAPFGSPTHQGKISKSEDLVDFIVYIGETKFISRVPKIKDEIKLIDCLFEQLKESFNQRDLKRENMILIKPKGTDKPIIAIQGILSGNLIEP